MHDAVTTYFEGEKNAGLFLAGMAVIGLLAAGLLIRERFGLRSFAITLGIVALLELALGVGLYLRTGPQVGGLLSQLARDRAGFQSDEDARMARVQRNFVIVQYAELAVIIACALIAVTQKAHSVRAGVALGLLVHASALLAFDIVAERRGAVYLSAIGTGRPGG